MASHLFQKLFTGANEFVMRLLYTSGIYLYLVGVHLAQWFSPKARLWVQGRRGWREALGKGLQSRRAGQRLVWMHCASLGEFEQGRPVLEGIKTRNPDIFVMLTFFSPSGYMVRRNYEGADLVCYLPMDTPGNVRYFLDQVRADLIIFVKYEFWFNFLHTMARRAIPAVLISARFRPGQLFFRWYGGWFRRHLRAFQFIFLQDAMAPEWETLLPVPTEVVGDTRVDRVVALSAAALDTGPRLASWRVISSFCGDGRVLIAGSCWPPDEVLLRELFLSDVFTGWKLILAPHDISEAHLRQLEQMFPGFPRFSQLDAGEEAQVRGVIIDNIGMLAGLYRYGALAWIGGGMGSGLHNTLEPAAFGLPVFIGPRYQKFPEAVQMVATGAAQVVEDSSSVQAAWAHWQDESAYARASAAARGYIEQHKGASQQILEWLCARNWI